MALLSTNVIHMSMKDKILRERGARPEKLLGVIFHHLS